MFSEVCVFSSTPAQREKLHRHQPVWRFDVHPLDRSRRTGRYNAAEEEKDPYDASKAGDDGMSSRIGRGRNTHIQDSGTRHHRHRLRFAAVVVERRRPPTFSSSS